MASFGDGRKLLKFGNYNLDGVSLGEGAFGKVEKATHTKVKTKVALKFVEIKKIKDDYELKYLTREAQLLLELKHDNIARVIEVVTSKEIYCLCVEYVPGRTLLDDLQNNGIFSEQKAKEVAAQLSGAIAYIHARGIIHRDLKLENVMISGVRVVVIDFGLSTKWQRGQFMNTHCGSAEYAAPELFNRDRYYGPSIDVWSFGIMLYAMMTGVLPFNSDKSNDQVTLIPKVLKGLGSEQHRLDLMKLSVLARSLIKRCLKIDSSKRITSGEVFDDPWIYLDNPIYANISKDGIRESKDVQVHLLQRMKYFLNLPLNSNSVNIIKHINSRPYGTTAALYRLLDLESERKLPVLQDVTNTLNKQNRILKKAELHDSVTGPRSILKSKFVLPQQQSFVKYPEESKSETERKKTVRFFGSHPKNEDTGKNLTDDLIFNKRPKRIRAQLRI